MQPQPESSEDDRLGLLSVAEAIEVVPWVTSWRDAVQFAGPDVAWPLTAETLVGGAPGFVAHRLRDGAGRVVATGSLRRIDDHVVRIGRVIVDPAARGQGWGRRVMSALLGRAEEMIGDGFVTLGVYTFNTPAVALYTDLGFRGTGEADSIVVDGETWAFLQMRWPVG